MIQRLALILLFTGSFFLLLGPHQLVAWDSGGEDENRWQEHSERINGLKFEVDGSYNDQQQGRRLSSKAQAELAKLRQEMEKKQRKINLQWKKRAKAIKEKWGTLEESSAKVFVDYTADNNAFGKINYEKGFLEVGAIGPASLIETPFRIERMLSERLAFLLSAESVSGQRDLQNQILIPGTGKMITKKNLWTFSEKFSQSRQPLKNFVAPDGVKRIKKQMRINFLPNHLEIRMQQYVPLVERAASIYGVASELILAVIQTESSFNHRAVSNAGAVGLMQLVPGTAGLEASKLVYGEPKLLSRDELYQPIKNIELGTAYLHILLSRYFEDYSSDPDKLHFLAIASYNCGPRRVKQALGSYRNVDELTSEELYQLLIESVPPETRKYLEQVVERMRQYVSKPGKISFFRHLFTLLFFI